MALPSNNGVFIHEGYNCTPIVVPTAQSIPMSTSDNTTVKSAIDTILSDIAEEYDSTLTYAVGDCVIYDKVLYKCKTAITVAEAWNSSHWEEVKAVDVGSGGGGGASSLHDLTDVNDAGKSDGDALVYNSTSSKWLAKHIIIKCTQAEYDAWESATPTQIDPDIAYFITDGDSEVPSASVISYNNSTSGLTATNVQGAIDEITTYAINEKIIGTWIDDKPIYQCVFTGFNITSTADTWVETTVSASNIGTLINGRIIDSSGQSFICSLGFNNSKVVINMPIARSNLTTLILEYTKT